MRQVFFAPFAAFMLALAAALPAAAQNRAAPAPLFETPGLAVEALEAIAERAGRELRVTLIDIRGSEMIVHAQGASPGHVDRWTWMRRSGIFLGFATRVRGPEPVRQSGPLGDPGAMFFSVEDLPLEDLPALIERISPRAMLEEPAPPQYVRIDRLPLFVGAGAADPRIMVHWSTERESSYVYLNPDGSIRSADVSGTFRARGLDMVRDDWHLPMAAEELGFLRGYPDVLNVEIEPRDIDVTYLDPRNRERTTGMRWTLNGLSVLSGGVQHPAMVFRATATQAPFDFSRIDFSVLPALKAEAVARVDEPGARVLKLVASRPVTSFGEPELVWMLTVGDPAKQGNWLNRVEGETWQVVASPSGEILRVVLPASRRPQVEWWTPASLRDAIDRLGTTFPQGHLFQEILLHPQGGIAHAVLANDPERWGQFHITAHDITRAPNASMRHHGLDATWFAVHTLDGYSAETISDLIRRTFDTVGLPDGRVTRLTFSRGNRWVRPPEGQVMLEIRVERGLDGGRLTWLADGTELDRVTP